MPSTPPLLSSPGGCMIVIFSTDRCAVALADKLISFCMSSGNFDIDYCLWLLRAAAMTASVLINNEKCHVLF